MNHLLPWLHAILACALLASFGCEGEITTNQLLCTPSCAGKSCGDDGCGGSCGSCGPGLACGADNTCVSTFCGNGSLEPNETCDPAITVGQGVCPSLAACADDGSACTREEFFGSPEGCDAECKRFNIIACEGGDGCCPSGCSDANDYDCSTTCGNDVVDDGETCDPPDSCPTQADCEAAGDADGDRCTAPTLAGSVMGCSAECVEVAITECIDGDGCCAQGCDDTNDDDCPSAELCGNGTLDDAEDCDPAIADGEPGACPTDPSDCDDGRACTTDAFTGSPDACTATCMHTEITAPADGDGCCPSGATDATDDDCPASNLCGNGTLDNGEACDPAIAQGNTGACPANDAACDDDDPCTVDAVGGDPSACTAACAHTTLTSEIDDDGCCLPGSSADSDIDCVTVCLTYCTEAADNCTGANELYSDLLTCMPACEPLLAGNPGAQSGDTVECRIYHLGLAAADPATHCPHARTTSSVCN